MRSSPAIARPVAAASSFNASLGARPIALAYSSKRSLRGAAAMAWRTSSRKPAAGPDVRKSVSTGIQNTPGGLQNALQLAALRLGKPFDLLHSRDIVCRRVGQHGRAQADRKSVV